MAIKIWSDIQYYTTTKIILPMTLRKSNSKKCHTLRFSSSAVVWELKNGCTDLIFKKTCTTDACNYLVCHLPHSPYLSPEHLPLHYSADGLFLPLGPQQSKIVAAFVCNTAVGTTAAYTDGNAVPVVAGSILLAVRVISIILTQTWLMIISCCLQI